MSNLGEEFLKELRRRSWELNPPPRDSYLHQFQALREVWKGVGARGPALLKESDELQQLFRPDQGITGFASAQEVMDTPDFEDFVSYGVMRAVMEEIRTELRGWGRSVEEDPLLGTIRTRTVNAMSIVIDPTRDLRDYIVILDSGLLSFLAAISEMFINMAPISKGEGTTNYSMDPEAIEAYLEQAPDVVERILAAATRIIDGKHPIATPATSDFSYRNETDRYFHGVLYHLAIVFVLGHEIGHIEKGHLDNLKFRQRFLSEPAMTVVGTEHNWLEEVEADAAGLELAIAVGQRYNMHPSIGMLAADLFLIGAFLLECLEAVRSEGSVEGGLELLERQYEWAWSNWRDASKIHSHPPARIRRVSLCEIVKSSVPPELADQLMSVSTNNSQAMTPLLWTILSAVERTERD